MDAYYRNRFVLVFVSIASKPYNVTVEYVGYGIVIGGVLGKVITANIIVSRQKKPKNR